MMVRVQRSSFRESWGPNGEIRTSLEAPPATGEVEADLFLGRPDRNVEGELPAEDALTAKVAPRRTPRFEYGS